MTENPNNRPAWDIDTTHPDIVAPLTDGMREIVDPEIQLNIIQLGLIRNVRITDEDAQINMILTTPFCPYGPALIDITRKKAEEILKKPTYITLGAEMWDFSMMEGGAADDWGMY